MGESDGGIEDWEVAVGGRGSWKGDDVLQYAEGLLQEDGCGSLYVYVSVTPPSYEHAHSSTAVVDEHASLPKSQHTVPEVGASPTDGCGVLSQPAACVPHIFPGGSLCMRTPASPANWTHEALARSVVASSGFEQSLSVRAGIPTLRQYWSRIVALDCGQPAWHSAADTDAGGHEGAGDGGDDGGGGGGDGLAGGGGDGECGDEGCVWGPLGLQWTVALSLFIVQPVLPPGRAGQSISCTSLPVQATLSIQNRPL